MDFSIPIYIRQHDKYLLRPLFVPDLVVQHRDLDRGLARLTDKLRKELRHLNREARHDKLARYSFNPDFEDRQLELRLYVHKKTTLVQFLFVIIKQWERRLVYVPFLGDVWFDLERGEDLRERATAVLTEYFRKLAQDEENTPESTSLKEKAWIMSIDLDVAIRHIAPKPKDQEGNKFVMLGGRGEVQGDEELETVGRCLDWQYPDGLSRAFLREREIDELKRVLTDERRRPVALVGPLQVGKTAIIHEHVRRVIQKRGGRSKDRQFWNLAPQRLISGMSCVGQWEERVLAILKEARKRKHVLYFDDFLGLYQAGVSASSDLNVATMLKPHVEQHDVSILVEMTPENFRVLQELDRGFADLFHLIHIREPGKSDTLKILIRLVRELEGRHGCDFHPGVLPMVIDLQRRYARHLAFPGKAAGFLEQLAVKYQKKTITPQTVLDEFHLKSGLSLSILDDRISLLRSEVIERLQTMVIGQQEAIEAMADAVSIAKARLNDPTRPLASFLFPGPTGVGKTQCAKALATYLFGDETRLLRFDMNEYIEPDAVARLVGTFRRPEGLLTSAIRQSPFSVLLLDEIEKAHPNVFDLLLQVLDDGRLTDALGRTADFTSTIIILTSNLGVREAGSKIGFQDTQADEMTHSFVKAAENFFRPEFFNRLDRIVPFRPLKRKDIETICANLIEHVLTREGLVRRKCLLDIDPQVLKYVAKEGFHPQLGARALKRSIERIISRPLAANLAGMTPERPTVVCIHKQNGGISVYAEELREAAPGQFDLLPKEPRNPGQTIRTIRQVLSRVDQEIEQYRPEREINPSDLTLEQKYYYEVRERMAEVRNAIEILILTRRKKAASRIKVPAKQMRARRSKKRFRHLTWDAGPTIQEIWAADDMRDFLKSLLEQTRGMAAEDEHNLLELLHQVALLQAVLDAGPQQLNQRVLLSVQGIGTGAETPRRFLEMFQGKLVQELSLISTSLDEQRVLIEGPLAYQLLRHEAGSHLFSKRHGGFELVCLNVKELTAEDESDTPGFREEAYRFPEVIRIYDEGDVILDLRTGLLLKAKSLSPEEHRTLLLSQLPLPEELRNKGL